MSGDRYIDHGAAQDAYERLLPRLDMLASEDRHREALEALDDLLESHQHDDADPWLRRTVLSHRALLLLEMGRADEALGAYAERARLGFDNPSERCELALGRGVCLTRLGRHAEAVEVLEEGLMQLPPSHSGSALGLLYRLAQSSAALGRPVPPQHLETLRAAAREHGVEVPASAADPERLGDAIKAVHRAATGRGE